VAVETREAEMAHHWREHWTARWTARWMEHWMGCSMEHWREHWMGRWMGRWMGPSKKDPRTASRSLVESCKDRSMGPRMVLTKLDPKKLAKKKLDLTKLDLMTQGQMTPEQSYQRGNLVQRKLMLMERSNMMLGLRKSWVRQMKLVPRSLKPSPTERQKLTPTGC
jgi:hypothetical protein